MFRKKDKQPTSDKPPHKLIRKMVMGALTVAMGAMAFMPTVLEASDSYFLTFTYNPDARIIVPGVTMSEVGNTVTNHAEIEAGANYLWDSDGALLFDMNDGTNAESFSLSRHRNAFTKEGNNFMFSESRPDGDYEYTIPFSFPGRHVGTGTRTRWGDQSTARQASASDQEQANWVGQQLTNGFNRLFADAHRAAGGATDTPSLVRTASRIANAAMGEGTQSFGDENYALTYKFETPEKEDQVSNRNPEIPLSDYRIVRVSGGGRPATEMAVPVRIPKGYGEGQRLYSRIEGSSYHDTGHHQSDVSHITWQHMVMQANMNAFQGVLAADAHELNPPGRLEQEVVKMLGGIAGNIKGFLGMEEINDLVFNTGMHGEGSVHGTMPVGMGQVADYVFFLMLMLAGVILLGSFVSLLVKSNLSVINPQMRVDLKDGLITIFGAFFLLIIFQPIWMSLMRLNSSLVGFFYHLSPNVSNIGSILVSNSGSIAAIILSIAFLVVEIWFNFYYIVRALTLMVLYMFAPLMIISLGYGGKYKMIFSNWSKEILGVLFIQSIHAAILGAIAAGLDQGMAQSLMWQYVVLISIIPLSNMFRKTILNLGGDSVSQTAGRAEKAAMIAGGVGGGLALRGASVAGGTVLKGIAGGAALKSASKDTGGNSGGNGGGNGGGKDQHQTKLQDEPKDMASFQPATAKTKMDRQEKITAEAKAAAKEGKSAFKRGTEAVKGGTDKVVGNMSEGFNNFKESPGKWTGDKALSGAKGALKGAGRGAKGTLKGAGRGAVGVAKWSQNDKNLLGGKNVGSAVTAAAGGLMTAGVVAGDMATETDSQSALLAGAKVMRGGGNGGGRGGSYDTGHSGNSYGQDSANASASAEYTSPEEIINQMPPESALDEIAENADLGTNGALIRQQTSDNEQMIVYDKETMGESAGISSVQTLPPSDQYPSGRTRMTVNRDNVSPDSVGGFDSAVHASHAAQVGDTAAYDAMREQTIFSNVQQTDGGYIVDVDNQKAGWSGTAVTNKHVAVKGDATASKILPQFNKNGNEIKGMREWGNAYREGAFNPKVEKKDTGK